MDHIYIVFWVTFAVIIFTFALVFRMFRGIIREERVKNREEIEQIRNVLYELNIKMDKVVGQKLWLEQELRTEKAKTRLGRS